MTLYDLLVDIQRFEHALASTPDAMVVQRAMIEADLDKARRAYTRAASNGVT